MGSIPARKRTAVLYRYLNKAPPGSWDQIVLRRERVEEVQCGSFEAAGM